MTNMIAVEVAYALPEKQQIVALEVPEGTTAYASVGLSKIAERFDELEFDDSLKLGIFGKAVTHEHVLAEGDRVEIYRPLLVDPKEVRKRRAEEAKQRRAEGED